MDPSEVKLMNKMKFVTSCKVKYITYPLSSVKLLPSFLAKDMNRHVFRNYLTNGGIKFIKM